MCRALHSCSGLFCFFNSNIINMVINISVTILSNFIEFLRKSSNVTVLKH